MTNLKPRITNAVISGLFFGSLPVPPPSTAGFVGTTSTPQGNWKGAFGSQGFDLAATPRNNPTFPAYVSSVTPTDAIPFVWAASTTDPQPCQALAGRIDRSGRGSLVLVFEHVLRRPDDGRAATHRSASTRWTTTTLPPTRRPAPSGST